MQLDYGRQQDLEMLYKEYQGANSSVKRRIESTMESIMSESGATRKLRDELIKATRVNHRPRMERCREELRRIQAERFNNNVQL